jgi:hypothetical protein
MTCGVPNCQKTKPGDHPNARLCGWHYRKSPEHLKVKLRNATLNGTPRQINGDDSVVERPS